MAVPRIRAADVAAAAGVSQTTVSLVLNGHRGHVGERTRLKVLEAATSLGYHLNAPARQLASGVTHTLGLVVSQSPEQVAADTFLGAMLRGLASVAQAAGYRVVVEPASPGDGVYGSLLRSGHVDALAVSGPRTDDAELEALVRERYPVVLHGSRPDLEVPSVDVDNVAGARLAVEHLLAYGHRRIACVTFDLSYIAARERLAGYRAALAAAGIEPDDSLVVETGYRGSGVATAVAELLGRRDVTAVFAAADLSAAGVLGALRAIGRRVPDDVSLVGFDDLPLAGFLDPPLTTIHVPAVEVGEAVGTALLERIGGDTSVRRRLLPLSLMERASVARPSAPGQRKEGRT
jgi:LacI family transcriptional regulator